MDLFHVNILAVILATLLCMGIGALWYSNTLFAKAWMAGIGKRMEDLKPNPMNYGFVALAFLIMSFFFGKILYYMRTTDLTGSIELALMLWVGIVATTTGINYLFEGRPKKLFFINTGYFLIDLLVMSIVLGLWK